MIDDLVNTFIEVSLKEDTDFLRVKETLTRIGVASRKDKTLWQSCHILHKKKKFYIVHFKELFALDGKETDFTENDKARRNTIADLLEQWGLLTIVNPEVCKEPRIHVSQLKIIAHKDKADWNLEAKYSIGKR